MFRYFLGPQSDMAKLAEGSQRCALCSQVSPGFLPRGATCSLLSHDEKQLAVGCFDCLLNGRFEFWHDTEFGLLDATGLKDYGACEPAPSEVEEAALIGLRRTPNYSSWQQGLWLTHCRDFMAYIGTWKPDDFRVNAPDGNGHSLFSEMTNDQRLWPASDAQSLKDWNATYYAFRCLHCGKLRGNYDFA